MRSFLSRRELRRSCALLAAMVGMLGFTAGLCPASALACEMLDPSSVAWQSCILVEKGERAMYANRFEEADAVWQQLRVLDPSDPTAALYEVETNFWRLLYDEAVEDWDDDIRESCDEATRLAEKKLERSPDDAIALAQLGAALVHRARLDGIRGSYMSAGRVGEKGREKLERALQIDPALNDAKYPLGLYYYYTSVAPNILKWIKWLWFVPKSDRPTGRKYLTQVRDSGGRHAVDATFILMTIHTYHEPMDFDVAAKDGFAIHERYPTNSLFHSELIETLIKAGRFGEAIELAKKLEEGPVESPTAKGRPQLARILRAQATLLSGHPDAAWELLEGMDPKTAVLPSWGGAWINLIRGQIHDVRGERAQALAEYEHVKNLDPPLGNPRSKLIAEMGIANPVVVGEYSELPMVGAAQ
jgi:tetratricopeptide (TPR) repeat protein